MTTKPVLGYWNIRGLAQSLRCQLEYCGVEFEDKIYNVSQNEDGSWNRDEWLNVKPEMGMQYPNLPYIIDGESKFSETRGIHMYIAKKWKPELLGKTAAEIARIEELFDKVWDIKMKSTIPCYVPSELEGDALKDSIADSVHPGLSKLVESTEGCKWIAGENLTWLDFFYAELLEYMNSILDDRWSAEFPSTREYLERFKALDAIKAYESSDKYMKGPFNNAMARLGQN
jgi:glutathione S-transferase